MSHKYLATFMRHGTNSLVTVAFSFPFEVVLVDFVLVYLYHWAVGACMFFFYLRSKCGNKYLAQIN